MWAIVWSLIATAPSAEEAVRPLLEVPGTPADPLVVDRGEVHWLPFDLPLTRRPRGPVFGRATTRSALEAGLAPIVEGLELTLEARRPSARGSYGVRLAPFGTAELAAVSGVVEIVDAAAGEVIGTLPVDHRLLVQPFEGNELIADVLRAGYAHHHARARSAWAGLGPLRATVGKDGALPLRIGPGELPVALTFARERWRADVARGLLVAIALGPNLEPAERAALALGALAERPSGVGSGPPAERLERAEAAIARLEIEAAEVELAGLEDAPELDLSGRARALLLRSAVLALRGSSDATSFAELALCVQPASTARFRRAPMSRPYSRAREDGACRRGYDPSARAVRAGNAVQLELGIAANPRGAAVRARLEVFSLDGELLDSTDAPLADGRFRGTILDSDGLRREDELAIGAKLYSSSGVLLHETADRLRVRIEPDPNAETTIAWYWWVAGGVAAAAAISSIAVVLADGGDRPPPAVGPFIVRF